MGVDLSEFLGEFVAETQEHLAGVEARLLAWERAPAAIANDEVHDVFRAMHSIKGSAMFLELNQLGKLAHAVEDVLNLLRDQRITCDESLISTLLESTDVLARMTDDLDSESEQDVSGLVVILEAAANPSGPSQPVLGDEDAPVATAPSGGTSQPPAATAPAVVKEAAREEMDGPADLTDSEEAGAMQHPACETSIRVPVHVLDALMNLAGELVLSRNQLMQTVQSTSHGRLGSVASRIDQVTSEVQEAIMQTRMQTLASVFGRFPRVIRDCSKQLGKRCQLRIEGQEVEVDKSIIEAIGDPLTHLIRNAVDHGIELPAARRAAGKPEEGTVRLRALQRAGKVVIRVEDDGAGISADRLREKAVTKGLIGAEEARGLSEREALRLIFLAGFSTAAEVSGISGRGVGMDVVRSNVERLGGSVQVESTLGQGSAIELTLPLTLAIVPSLTIGCGERAFAVPQTNIRELLSLRQGQHQIERAQGAEVVRLRGELLPVVRLRNVLALDDDQEERYLIVVDTGNFYFGLAVHEVRDSGEIVVKPLGRRLQSATCLAGATILGNGDVAMILDVSGVAAEANLAMHRQATAGEVESVVEDAQEMVLLGSGDDQFAAPMQLVARLERADPRQFVLTGGRLTMEYRGAALPLIRLENSVSTEPVALAEKAYVMVFRCRDREVGLVAPRLEGIRTIADEPDAQTFREPGVMGSLLIDGRLTRLLDLYELTRAAFPSWFDAPVDLTGDEVEQERTILLAEDSDFFRERLADFLREQGHRVLACADGEEAWQTLAAHPRDVHLVVTDVEMPRLNGLELTRRIRQEAAIAELPVIAVTSLSSEEDRAHGRAAGVSEYLVKLDRERLLDAVRRLLARPALAV